jgi:glycosyltransferase involved in cell wall biosynthesis
MSTRDGRLLMARHTGVFLDELGRALGSLHLLQYALDHEDFSDLGGLCDLELSAHPWLTAHCVAYRARHPLWRHVDRARMYAALLAELDRRPWAYHFLPGRLPSFAALVCRRRRIPYGLYVRGIVDPRQPLTRRILADAAVTVCNNAVQAAQLADFAPRVETVAPMMGVSAVDLLPERTQHRNGPLTALFVGRASREKGFPELLRALELLAGEGRELRLAVVGSGPLADPRLLPAALRDRVRFAGFVAEKEQLAAEYLAADLFVLPSHSEGFPRVLYEAMTYALPVVTTFVGGVGSLMRDGGNCLRVEVGDAEGLARTLRRLADQPELRQALGRASLATMRAFYASGLPTHAQLVLRTLGRRHG